MSATGLHTAPAGTVSGTTVFVTAAATCQRRRCHGCDAGRSAFTPCATGVRQTTLRVVNKDSDKGTFDILLTGTGLTAQETARLSYFGSAADVADFDHDGSSNLFEYVAGLVPNDPASVFKWRIELVTSDPTQMKIIFSPIVTGRSYTVKTSPTLGSGAVWPPVTGGISSDNGNERTLTDTNATGGAKFYRVEIMQP